MSGAMTIPVRVAARDPGRTASCRSPADFKNDDAAAAKVLDVALARKGADDPLERARALAARLELAVALGEQARARALRDEIDEAPLSDEERAKLQPQLDAVDALDRS